MVRDSIVLVVVAASGIGSCAFVSRATGQNPETVVFAGADCMENNNFNCNIQCVAQPLFANGSWSCTVFTGQNVAFQIKECITTNATGTDTCTQNLSFNNGTCTGTFWTCSPASISGGIMACSVANCACAGAGGAAGNLKLNPNCT